MKKSLSIILLVIVVLVSSFSFMTYYEKENLIRENSNLSKQIASKDEMILALKLQVEEKNELNTQLDSMYKSLLSTYNILVSDYNIATKEESYVIVGENINDLIDNNVLPMYTKKAYCHPTKVFTFRFGKTGFATITTDINENIVSYNGLEDLLDYNTENN